jgi:hypothetical protein
MSESSPETENPQRPPAIWLAWLRSLLPYAITLVLAVAISLLLQTWFLRPNGPTIVVPTVMPTLVQATALPTISSTAPALATDIVRQELIDLRAEDHELWVAIYLSKAISQISDAESQMRANDLSSVAQSLVAVDGSLELAYEYADEASKSPIAELRRLASSLHDDLYIRPEGIDTRLLVLRQTILALIGER